MATEYGKQVSLDEVVDAAKQVGAGRPALC